MRIAPKSLEGDDSVTRHDNIGDDFYALIVRHDGTVLESSNNTTRWRPERRAHAQIMRFQRHSDNSYRISNFSSGRSLDVMRGNEQRSEIYFQYPHDMDNFWIERNGDHIMLSPKSGSNFVVDAAGGGNFTSGSELWTWTRNDTDNQWYYLKRIDNIWDYAPFGATQRHNIGDDFYALIERYDGTILTSENNATKWREERRAPAQIMRFQLNSDGSYRITNYASGRCLDVAFGGEQQSEIYFYYPHDLIIRDFG